MVVTESKRDRSGLIVGATLVLLGLGGVLYKGIDEARQMRLVRMGVRAPRFAMPGWKGGTVRSADFEGKVLLVNFWASWCAPCREEMPALVKLVKANEPRGLAFVAATSDDAATWKTDVSLFADKMAPALTQYATRADDETSAAFNVQVLPTTYFVGRDGKILASYTGGASEAQLQSRIDQALAASP